MTAAWIFALLLQAAPAPQRGADVVVTARPRPPEAVIRRRIRAITRRSGEQVARFTDPVCAGAAGLPEPYATRVAARIMADARAAGVPVAGPGCRPNITLVIVDDGKQLLTELRRRKPALFSAVPSEDMDRALAAKGPARAITVTALLSRDGNRPSGDQAGGNTSGPLNGAPILRVDNASIFDLATRQDITGSLVLIDTAATIGRTLNQLADYVAMRTLAKTDAVAASDDDTILSLFADPEGAPRGLTSFDAAFLRALYHGPATVGYGMKVSEMARAIARSDAKQTGTP